MGKKLTTKEFIKKAKYIHKNKYEYTFVNYVNSSTKVKIICLKHDVFEQTPNDHLDGRGCPKCAGNIKSNSNEFIEKAKIIHKNKYDYSLVEYKQNKTKVKIICPTHGEFIQRPNDHLIGDGCPKCGGTEKSNTSEFIKKANIIHNNKFDYSEINYIGANIKVKIKCPIHGIFEQLPSGHLTGYGCSKCSDKIKKTTEIFINKANIVHNNKYDYSETNYISANIKVKIKCPIHGIFEQIPNSHLRTNGCSLCSGSKTNINFFIEKANIIHNNKYDYSKTEYISSNKKLKIICPIHGEFLQTPHSHLSGNGCSICSSSRGELTIKNFLAKNNFNFEQQKKFDDCKNKQKLSFDFYLNNYNVLIEFDGRQHFMAINFFGGEKGLKLRQANDKIKNDYCKKKNIRLIRISYKVKNIEEYLENKLKELKIIIL